MSYQRGGFRPFGTGLMGSPMLGPYAFGPARSGALGGFGIAPLVRPPTRGGAAGANRGSRSNSNRGGKKTTPVKNNKSTPEAKKDNNINAKNDKKEDKKDEKKDDKKDEKKDDKKDDKKGGKTPTGKEIKVEPKDDMKNIKKNFFKDPKVEPKNEKKPDTKAVTVKPEIKKESGPQNVTLDKFNSELHLSIDADGLSAGNMKGEGFQYMWGGVRGTHGVKKGKVCYEVYLLENIKVHCPGENNPHVLRVGWSVDNSDYQLGEDKLSWGYGGTAKSSYDSKFLDYGKKYTVGDTITCYIDFESNPKAIFFMLNGEYLGVAFRFGNELGDKAVFPHITSKNMRFRVNFGKEKPKHHVTNGFRMMQDIPVDQLVLPSPSPKTPKEAEIIMMVGLPACGKSFWCEKYAKENPDKKYYILGTNNIIERMKVSGLTRKRNYHGRWEMLIKRASLVLNKLFTVAKNNPRNYVLDQTNVYFTARRRKMESFAGYKKIAAVIINKPDVLASRTEKQQKIEGKMVPEGAVMEMKFNFTLPEKGPSFNEVWYLEETLPKAQELAANYRREGSNFKTKSKRKPESSPSQPESSPSSEKKPKLDPKIISRGFDKPFSKPNTNSPQQSTFKAPSPAQNNANKTPNQDRFSKNEKSTSKVETNSDNSRSKAGNFNKGHDGNKSNERPFFSNTPDRGNASNRGNDSNRGNSSDRGNAPNKGSFSDRGNAPNRENSFDRANTPNKGNFFDRGNTPNKGNSADRGNAPNKGNFADKGNAPNKGNSSDRGNAPNKGNASDSANKNSKNEKPKEESKKTPKRAIRGTLDQLNSIINSEARKTENNSGNIRDSAQSGKNEKMGSLMDIDRTPQRESDSYQNLQSRNRDALSNQGGKNKESQSAGLMDIRNVPQGNQDYRGKAGILDSSRNTSQDYRGKPGILDSSRNTPQDYRGKPGILDSSRNTARRNEYESPVGRGNNSYSDSPARGVSTPRGRASFNDSPARGARGGRGQSDISRSGSLAKSQGSGGNRGGRGRGRSKHLGDVNKYDPVGNMGGYYSALKALPSVKDLIGNRSSFSSYSTRIDEPSRFDQLYSSYEPYSFGRTQNANDSRSLNYSFGQTDSYSSLERDGGYRDSQNSKDFLGSYQQRKDSSYSDNRGSQGGQRGYQDSSYNADGLDAKDQYQNDDYQESYSSQKDKSSYDQNTQSSRSYNQETSYEESSDYGRSRNQEQDEYARSGTYERGDTSYGTDDANRSSRRYEDDLQESEPMDGNYSTQDYGRSSQSSQRARIW